MAKRNIGVKQKPRLAGAETEVFLMSNKIIPHPKAMKLPPGSGFMHLTLCFTPDGIVNFYPDAEDPKRLAREFKKIIKFLHKNPRAIVCAAGTCDGGCNCINRGGIKQ